MRTVKFVNLGKQYLHLREEILAKFDEISKEGAYILTRELADFESHFAEYCGTRYALGVGNGFDALYLSLCALNIGAGDEVITAPNSFVATAAAIARTGARIVFSDVGDDMNLDPALIESAITDRTKAIMPVHLTGRIADMDPIVKIAKQYQLNVIEDAAQAVGAGYKGKRAGAFGVCAGFSLHPLKNLHVHGDGGLITTDASALYHTLAACRNHGLRNRDECEFWGMNSRLDAIQAGIANIKLRHLDAWNTRIRAIACLYSDHLRNYVKVPHDRDDEDPVYHCYMIRFRDRDGLQRFLAHAGIETKVHYPLPLHLQPSARALGYPRGSFPMAEELSRTILSLPIYPELEDDEVHYVIDKIIQYCKKC